VGDVIATFVALAPPAALVAIGFGGFVLMR